MTMKKIPWISLGALALLWGTGSWFAWVSVPENAFDLNPIAAAAMVGVGLLLCLFQILQGSIRRNWVKVAIFIGCPALFFGQIAARGLLRWPG